MQRFSVILLVIGSVAIGIAYAMQNAFQDAAPPIADDRAAPPRPPEATLEITYIANEGVLVSAGDKQVLIDGLHREYRGYPFLPEPHQGRLETATAPFDKIDLVLVSHVHGDHFHPESVGRYMQHNAKSVLASSEQVVHEMQANLKSFDSIKARVTTVTPTLTQRIARTAAGVDVEFLGLGHGTERHRAIQNLGHIVRLGGKTLLHVGDADTSVSIFEPFNLDQEGIDIAFLPLWFLTEPAGQTIIREHIKPRHIVVIHMPTAPGTIFEGLKPSFPTAVAFTTLLEKRYY